MDERENRDDLIRRVVQQKESSEKRVVSAKEREAIAKAVQKDVMPQVYQK